MELGAGKGVKVVKGEIIKGWGLSIRVAGGGPQVAGGWSDYPYPRPHPYPSP